MPRVSRGAEASEWERWKRTAHRRGYQTFQVEEIERTLSPRERLAWLRGPYPETAAVCRDCGCRCTVRCRCRSPVRRSKAWDRVDKKLRDAVRARIDAEHRPSCATPREAFPGLDLAAIRALWRAGIRSPGRLFHREDEELLRLRGIGPVTLRRIKAWLSEQGAWYFDENGAVVWRRRA